MIGPYSPSHQIDTETFKGDISVVKAITGGDSIAGREKHKENKTQTMLSQGFLHFRVVTSEPSNRHM